MTVTYLDPAEGPPEAEADMSQRPERLEGLTIGLLNNGKSNADNLLEYVAEELSGRYPDLKFEQIDKPSPFKPAPDEQLQDVSVKYGAIITGVGD